MSLKLGEVVNEVLLLEVGVVKGGKEKSWKKLFSFKGEKESSGIISFSQ
jgi:hypothetical protein